jgi:hypothetical protein
MSGTVGVSRRERFCAAPAGPAVEPAAARRNRTDAAGLDKAPRRFQSGPEQARELWFGAKCLQLPGSVEGGFMERKSSRTVGLLPPPEPMRNSMFGPGSTTMSSLTGLKALILQVIERQSVTP